MDRASGPFLKLKKGEYYMAEKRDYYEILGVNKSASKDEIKSAYRKLAKKYHPDNKETGNEAKFKEIQEAYDILYDDQKRSAYDQFGHAAFEQAGGNPGANPFQGGFSGFGGFGDLGDIINSFFTGGRGQARANPNQPRRGNDEIKRIRIDFMDAINGKDIEVPIEVDEQCPTCHGSGAKSASDIITCSQCGGKGYVSVKRQSLFGSIASQEICPSCGGKGKTIKNKCPDCLGKGYIHKKKNIKVHIPAGINHGQQIVSRGNGERGINGGPNGDLYFEILVKPHEYFLRDGNDISLEIPLDFVDACLGTKVDVPTVYGDMTLTIPSGSQPGQILRMKGCGVKDLRSGKPGDQYIKLNIKVPTSLSKGQKELLEKLRDTRGKDEGLFAKFKKMFKK